MRGWKTVYINLETCKKINNSLAGRTSERFDLPGFKRAVAAYDGLPEEQVLSAKLPQKLCV